ncbi:hypothetical protein D3P08_09745 [Paenibacillus nanensis]|uniref:Uncharacterized protein n=1 Tax=Paenibacillus nanensis TaxID=393251 RepID=A0A3A1UZJ3_9BACL|nr:hypothetical protein [Paenibacillus nanensis]RIX53694.1 hypothetical protein D3P08_09745 [Paenibacillus nanensis]
MSRKRVIIEAVGVGAAASAVLTTLLMILMGSILTAAYVPDIVNSYASVDYLESKVAFGKREEIPDCSMSQGLFYLSPSEVFIIGCA